MILRTLAIQCCLPQRILVLKIIEDYIEEMSASLAYIASNECHSFSLKEK